MKVPYYKTNKPFQILYLISTIKPKKHSYKGIKTSVRRSDCVGSRRLFRLHYLSYTLLLTTTATTAPPTPAVPRAHAPVPHGETKPVPPTPAVHRAHAPVPSGVHSRLASCPSPRNPSTRATTSFGEPRTPDTPPGSASPPPSFPSVLPFPLRCKCR